MSERRDGHLLASLAIYLEYLHFHLLFIVSSCISLLYLDTLWVSFVFKENSDKFWIIQANSLVYSDVGCVFGVLIDTSNSEPLENF